VFNRNQTPNRGTKVRLGSLLVLVKVEVEELDVELGRAAEGREEDVTTFGGPEDVVEGFVVEGL
jgi:hypothetical protein